MGLLAAARRVLEERLASGVATTRERLAVVALHELADENDEAAVRAWVPSAAFRAAFRPVALSTVESTSASSRPWSTSLTARAWGDVGETMH